MEIITAAIFGLTASTLTFERVEAAPIPFHAIEIVKPEPTLQELSDQAAERWGVSSSTLRQLVHEESRWNPEAVGDGGCSIGLVQINLCAHKNISKEQALDPVFALNFAAQHMSEGLEYLWVPCNCYGLVKTKIPILPRMRDIQPNAEASVGAVSIYDYKGTKHVAYVFSVEPDGFWEFGANLKPCEISTRFVPFDHEALQGFWYPN